MSTTTMHFGPEWMRTKQQSVSRTQPPPPPSPPPAATPQTPNASSYSALVSPAPPIQPQKQDETHPFRYSKEEMLRIYKESSKGGLGLEVERWEGVVREIGTDPIGMREIGENEKKLFAISLNSDLRRRQSSDYLNLNTQNLERPRLVHSGTGSGSGSPLRERYGSMSMLQRRRDSTDQAPNITPRKLSLSGQAPLGSPRDVGLPSPRRLGHTPSFDGVLNGGESWISRRRTSESLGKTVGMTREPSGDENEIREEEEENRVEEKKPDPQDSSTLPSQTDQPANGSGIASQKPQDIENRLSQLSLDQGLLSSPNPPPASAPAPPTDLASVDWSYLDPQGQVQGPFRADLMQKWSDDGYFTSDLLMKRNNIDTDWMTVAELARRTGGGKLFLSLIAPPLPPGLTRHTDSPFGLVAEQTPFNNSPYQPSPIRSIRSSTLDSYIPTGSNPSDSPASSFGGGGRFGDGSPDPAAFGGRVSQYGAGDIAIGRVGGFGMTGSPSPALPGRRNTFTDSVDYRSAGFNNMLPPRGPTVDNGFGMNGSSGFNSPWGSGNFDGLSGGGRSSADPPGYQATFSNNPGLVMNTTSLGGGSFSDLPGNTAPYRVSDFGYGTASVNQQGLPSQEKILGGYNRPLASAPLYGDPSSQTIPASVVPQYNVNLNQPQQQQHIPPSIQDLFDQNQARQIPNQFSGSESSPWGAIDSPVNKHPGPFDASHSISTNIAGNAPTQSSPWETALQTHQTPGVGDPPQSTHVREDAVNPPSSSAQREETTVQPIETSTFVQDVVTIDPSPPPPPPAASIEEAPSPAPVPSEQTSPSLKVKTTPTLGQQTAPASRSPVEPIAVTTAPSPLQSIHVTSKAPWAKDDDTKKLSTATSLRQIQDAEAKKAEARKREREKERAAASATGASGNEELQGFTTSWGLPTSQAGRGSGSSIVSPSKETIATPSPTPVVWTSAAKATTARKSMKEIQEEEERRKKVIAAAAAKEGGGGGGSGVSVGRRGYADSTSKSAPAIVQGNAWTTVGPSGKAVAPVTRPVPPPSTASSSSVPRTNGATTAATATRLVPPTSSKPSAPAASKVEDFPLPPSIDFMRWLGDNMKGLNSSVNVEEIMSMLLSFPLDPDPSTTEIISDLIYANSTTLDGRRFAADFVSKRKADAVARSKGTGGAGAKSISIADVVKAQPKQQTSEWGGFKVVNKKKKGGRP